MNYPFNQKCTIKNCIKRDTDHLYDSTTCCDLLEDQEDLDLIEFSQGEAKYEDQRKMFADIVDESQFLNETIEEPKKDNLGSNQKIKKFFEDWGSLEKKLYCRRILSNCFCISIKILTLYLIVQHFLKRGF